MDPPAPTRRTDEFAPALGIVLATAALQLTLAHLVLSLLLRSAPLAPDGARGAVGLVIAATTVAALVVFYLRVQYGDLEQVARAVPRAFAFGPPVAAALLVPVVIPLPDVAGFRTALEVLAPVIGAPWAVGIALAPVTARALRSLATRSGAVTADAAVPTEPPGLVDGYSDVLVAVTASASVFVLASMLGSGVGIPATAVGWLPLVGLAALVLAAWGIGAMIGQSPGGEIASIARRLDAFGHDARHAEHAPIVSTSADEVGDLLRGLEELRVRLDAEIALYQDALDRTRAADALKADFLSAVSHELRTPLNTVGGYAQLLLEGVPTPLSQPQNEDVRLIKAGGERLLELINDILDVSMIESGELRLAFASVSLDEVIGEVVQLHQPLVRDRQIELLVEIGPDLPQVICDRRRIGQIVTNLVSNAIKFTENGSITVRASFDPRRGEVVVRSIDTGIGIAPEELDLIFEEYRQVGAAARRKKGTGLGLAIARTIARYHGGTLTVESTPGRGSIFTLTLPLEPPKLPESIDIAEEAARSRMRAHKRGGTWSGWSGVEVEP